MRKIRFRRSKVKSKQADKLFDRTTMIIIGSGLAVIIIAATVLAVIISIKYKFQKKAEETNASIPVVYTIENVPTMAQSLKDEENARINEKHENPGPESLLNDNPERVELSPNEILGVYKDAVDSEESALNCLKACASKIGIRDVDKEYKLLKSASFDGIGSYRFKQYYNDIPVENGIIEISTDMDGKNPIIRGYYRNISGINTEDIISQDDAWAIVKEHIGENDHVYKGREDKIGINSCELQIWAGKDNEPDMITYKINYGNKPDMTAYVDALSNDLVSDNSDIISE